MTTDTPKVHVHMKVSSLEKSLAFYDGVEWEVYVLNHDIGDDTAGCATTQPMKSSLGVVNAATSCCAPAR